MTSTLYVGIDESNHGRFPEVFVAVSSINPADAKIISLNSPDHFLQKKRYKASLEEIIKIPHFVIFAEKEDISLYEKNMILPNIYSSLLYRELINYDKVHLFIDGYLNSREISEIKKLVSKANLLNPSQIFITSSPKLDQRCPLVNYADFLANYYSRNFSQRAKSKKIFPFEKSFNCY